MTRYWIIVASRDHVARGVDGGFAQANHGKSAPLKRLRRGDGIVYYSSKAVYGSDEPCQCFTAIGEVADDTVYRADMGNGFVPARRSIRYVSAHDAPIRSLIDDLSFIRDKRRWGVAFRFGMLEIPAQDYERIAAAMRSEATYDRDG